MKNLAIAGEIHRYRDPTSSGCACTRANDLIRIGRILDHVNEGEWWLIQTNREVEWLCERVFQLQLALDKKGAA
jgi:hypothetical protein